MKNLFLIAVIALGFSAVSFGQNGNVLSINTESSAQLLKVLTITEVGSLNFGSITIPQAAATIVLTPDGERSVGTGAATLLGITPATIPTYTVSGDKGANFAIVIPIDDVELASGVTDKIIVNVFTCSIVGLHSTLDGNTGLKDFTVGATLNIDENDNPGLYVGSFDVSVAYE